MEERFKIDIEAVFKKNSKFKLPKFALKYLKKIVHQQDINEMIQGMEHPKGKFFFKETLEHLNISYTVKGIENIPNNKSLIFTGNHPLGGPEALIIGAYFVERYDDAFLVPSNSILCSLKPLSEFFVPVNAIGGRQSREIGNRMSTMFESDKQILIYPAGMCAKKEQGKIIEQPWKKMFVSKARTYHRDVVPVHCTGQNSWWYYFMSKLSKFLGLKMNLGMLYLVDELFKQRNKKFTLTFGKPIAWEEFDKSKTDIQWAADVKDKTMALNPQNKTK